MNIPPQHVPITDDPDGPLLSKFWYERLKQLNGVASTASVATDVATLAAFTIGAITAQWIELRLGSRNSPGRTTAVLQLTIPVTPPATIGDIQGAHLYIENPDQSTGTTLKLDGTTPLGAAQPLGDWSPQDLGQMAYNDQPLVVNVEQATAGQTVRMYVQAYTAVLDPAPVRAGLTGATPSATIRVPDYLPAKPGNGIDYEPLIKLVSVTTLAEDFSTGKSRTPVVVTVDTSVLPNPAPDGWACEVVLFWDADAGGPNDLKNIVSGTFTVDDINNSAGVIPAAADGITAPHTLALETPKSLLGVTVYVRSLQITQARVSGRGFSRGAILRNTIVPGVTPSAHITIGTLNGTVDIAAALAGSISSEFHVVTVAGQQQLQMLNLDMSKASRLSSQFAFDATLGVQKIAQLDAGLIITGQFQVGGGGNKVSQMKVFDTSNTLIGWIGDDSLTSGAVGAWFKRVYIGGTSPATAKIVADSLGNVAISGSLIVGSVSSANFASVAAIFNGTIQATQVIAGQFTGMSMVLNKNGITSTFDNVPDPTGAGISGLKIQDNSTLTYALHTPTSFAFMPVDPLSHIPTAIAQLRVNPSGGGDWQGQLIVSGTSGVASRRLEFRPSPGVIVTDNVAGISGIGLSQAVSYTKPGGATGTLTFCMGWLISAT